MALAMKTQEIVKGTYLNMPPKEVDVKAPLKKVLKLSDKHPVEFPVQSAQLKTLLKKYPWPDELQNRYGDKFDEGLAQKFIDSCYPVIHEKLVPLLVAFIKYKRKSPERVERKYYRNKNPYELIDKLLLNRPFTFVGTRDNFMRADETFGMGDTFEKIGKDSTRNPDLGLDKLNSYDEMKIAALVGVSGWSHFINDGIRKNCGKLGDGKSHELQGVVVAQVGPRFQKWQFMDCQDFIVTEKFNLSSNGYGKNSSAHNAPLLKMWAEMWGAEYFPTHDKKEETGREYAEVPLRSMFLDKDLYIERILMMAEVLLLEAEHRSKGAKKKAYVHVTGLGLGVWRVSNVQTELYIQAWAKAIEKLAANGMLGNVAYIDFSWIPVTEIRGIESEGKFPGTDITIRFSKRDLHARVPKGCFLICNFAWDSNSPPGNEYWSGSLDSSADPAAACSSGVAELHNARINPRLRGACTRVASVTKGVMSLQEYFESVKDSVDDLAEESEEDESDYEGDEVTEGLLSKLSSRFFSMVGRNK